MTKKHDHIDKKILKIVQQDADLAVADIADLVGLSQSPCWRRIKQLQEDGIISKKVVKLSRQKLGLGVVVFVSIKLSSHGRAMLDEFEQAIVDYAEVVECWTISGAMDYMLRVVEKDMESYEFFLRNKLLSLPHIQEAQSQFTISEVKNTHVLPLD